MTFFLKRLFVFLIPLYIIVIVYFILDPFKVLYHYDDYSKGTFLQLNRDYVSTQTYLNKNLKFKYNSFLFGSSRTVGISLTEWIKNLPPESKPFSFDASNENIYGIERKINLLKETHAKINNALILICGDVFFNYQQDHNYLYAKHPKLSGENIFSFHLKFIKAFLTHGFFIRYFDYILFSKQRPYMNGFLDFREVNYNVENNNMDLKRADEEIQVDSTSYYLRMRDFFYKRPETKKVYPPQIGSNQIQLLENIKAIFDSNLTDYKIIISPLYNQIEINPVDLSKLNSIFGNDRVFNFSGVNRLTNEVGNYYESSHFRKLVGNNMLNSIYFSSKNAKTVFHKSKQ
jgi:hypothetical protein